jgi:NhaP-type Na+/H+ and K+/H+ antiporter
VFVIVLASVLVQGTTISPAARRLGVPMTRIVPTGRDDHP